MKDVDPEVPEPLTGCLACGYWQDDGGCQSPDEGRGTMPGVDILVWQATAVVMRADGAVLRTHPNVECPGFVMATRRRPRSKRLPSGVLVRKRP